VWARFWHNLKSLKTRWLHHAHVGGVGGLLPTPQVLVLPSVALVLLSELFQCCTAQSLCCFDVPRDTSGLEAASVRCNVVKCTQLADVFAAAAAACRYWATEPSYRLKFPLFISIDGQDQRTTLLAAALREATGAQLIIRR
jgi:hypothetical protein